MTYALIIDALDDDGGGKFGKKLSILDLVEFLS